MKTQPIPGQSKRDKLLIPETRWFHALWGRIDRCGIYLYTSREGYMMACWSFQWAYRKGFFFTNAEFYSTREYFKMYDAQYINFVED